MSDTPLPPPLPTSSSLRDRLADGMTRLLADRHPGDHTAGNRPTDAALGETLTRGLQRRPEMPATPGSATGPTDGTPTLRLFLLAWECANGPEFEEGVTAIRAADPAEAVAALRAHHGTGPSLTIHEAEITEIPAQGAGIVGSLVW